MAIVATLALLLWLVVPRAIDQVDQALGGVPTSQQELSQKATHSTGLKHEFFSGLNTRLKALPSAGNVVHLSVTVGTTALGWILCVVLLGAATVWLVYARPWRIQRAQVQELSPVAEAGEDEPVASETAVS